MAPPLSVFRVRACFRGHLGTVLPLSPFGFLPKATIHNDSVMSLNATDETELDQSARSDLRALACGLHDLILPRIWGGVLCHEVPTKFEYLRWSSRT